MYIDPTVADFKAFFSRDFPYELPPPDDNPATQVTDADIQRALTEAKAGFFFGCFESQESYTLNMLYLAAHYLVLNLRASAGGIAGVTDWMATSKSVGSVSISSAIPQRILDNPLYAMYASTAYGLRYLQNILPCLVGRIFAVPGRTHA